MKKEYYKEIEIPEEINVNLDENLLKVSGPEGENQRKINLYKIDFQIKNNKISIGNKLATKKEKKRINTLTSHIKNLIKGVQEKFEYTLKICSSHFPMSVKAQEKEIIIKNFLGEKIERKSQIPGGVDIEINKDIITIKSTNKELAGQAAANLERATKIKGRDIRIFQDGIYLINKAGKEI